MAGGAIISGPGGRSASYNKGRLTPYVLLACFVGACTGLVFGYDIGIAGGVISYPDFQARFFPHVLNHHADTNAFCKYSDPLIQLFVSVLFLAGIVGAFIGSFTSKKFGRKPTMMLGGIFFLLGAILLAPAVHVAMLMVGRICMGLGVGICVQCGPLFLSELAPYHLRGAFNTQFQVSFNLGSNHEHPRSETLVTRAVRYEHLGQPKRQQAMQWSRLPSPNFSGPQPGLRQPQ
eukprot:GHUV01034639.1.p1 GENE.GHUV01034639.1~~GHUV01034639.1.p1  ORF type:complete len:233 (+),score=22.43 GHUV01034639.1:133-831(+)